MIEINASELRNELNMLSTLIDEYEETKLNIFNQLKDSCTNNWQDGNSIEFDNEIYSESQEGDSVVQYLKTKKELFDDVYNKYSDIGQKIKCNLNNKTTLLHSIENCSEQLNKVYNEFNKVDMSFYYQQRYAIQTQKEKIVSVRNDLIEVKRNLSEKYKQIEEIEQDIDNKIKRMEEININNFDYNLI